MLQVDRVVGFVGIDEDQVKALALPAPLQGVEGFQRERQAQLEKAQAKARAKAPAKLPAAPDVEAPEA